MHRTLTTLTIAALVASATACTSTPESHPSKAPAAAAAEKSGKKSDVTKQVVTMTPDERTQLFIDLDEFTQQWMAAFDQEDASVWNALAGVIGRRVDDHLDLLLDTLADKSAGRSRVIAARALGFGNGMPKVHWDKIRKMKREDLRKARLEEIRKTQRENYQRIDRALVAALGSDEKTLVSSSLVSLYHLKDPDTPLEPMVALLGDTDPHVRSNAALAIYAVLRARAKTSSTGHAPHTPEVEAATTRLLLNASSVQETPSARAHAATALGEIGDPDSTQTLIALLSDKNSEVRVGAEEGLGQMGDAKAIPALIRAMDAKDPKPYKVEKVVIAAAIRKIADTNGWTCNAEVLGTDASRWRTWYTASVKQDVPKSRND